MNFIKENLIINLLSEIDGFKLNDPKVLFMYFLIFLSFLEKKIKNKVINNSTDFAFFLLEEANVATVPEKLLKQKLY